MSQIGIIFGKTRAFWTRIDGTGAAFAPAASFFDSHPVYAGITEEVIDGQSMVRVPAFYCRAGAQSITISAEPAEGFELHPAFRPQRHQPRPLLDRQVPGHAGRRRQAGLASRP